MLAVYAIVAFLVLGRHPVRHQARRTTPPIRPQRRRPQTDVQQTLTNLGVPDTQTGTALNQLDLGKITGWLTGHAGRHPRPARATCSSSSPSCSSSAPTSPASAPASPPSATTNPQLAAALTRYATAIRRYLIVTAVFGAIVGVLDTTALWLLGIPLPLLWGLFSFITNFVPNIGFVLGVIPPALLALLDGGWSSMLAVLAVYSLLNVVIQTFIQPRFVGDSVGLSTTVAFLSLAVWTFILGPLGALLAVPMTLLIRALFLDPDPHTQWTTALIATNPQPTPPPPARPPPVPDEPVLNEAVPPHVLTGAGMSKRTSGLTAPDTGVSAGLLVASAVIPGTFARSLSARSAMDQGIVTGLAAGLHYLLTVGTQDALQAAAAELAGAEGREARQRSLDPARRCRGHPARAGPPAGAATVARASRCCEVCSGSPAGARWRPGVGGTLLLAARAGTRALDARLGAGGRIASFPVAVPVGLGRRLRPGSPPRGRAAPPRRSRPSRSRDRRHLRSLAVAGGVVGGLAGLAYGEHALAGLARPAAGVRAARRTAAVEAGRARCHPRSARQPVLSPCTAGRCARSRPARRRRCRCSRRTRPAAGPGRRSAGGRAAWCRGTRSAGRDGGTP